MKASKSDFSNSYLSFIYMLLFVFFAITLLPMSTYAQEPTDVVYLKNGDILRGVIVEEIPFESIKMELPGGSTITVKYSDIAKITKERPSTKREAIHQTQPPKPPEVQPQQPIHNNETTSSFAKPSLLLSGAFFTPSNTDIENYVYGGVKGGVNVKMDFAGFWSEFANFWTIFAEYKISRLEMVYSTYSEYTTVGMFSVGVAYKHLFLDEKFFLGVELFFSTLNIKYDNNSESLSGYGIAPKIGFGNYFSPVLYLFIEAKYNEINYVDTYGDNWGLNGLGFELGANYYFNQ